MKFFDFFRKWIPTKNKKNYLRVYANWGKVSYSDIEKQNIIQLFSSILKKIYNPSSLKFDIYGPGYGISKGSPCFGQRAFDNKLKKFGYKKFGGMTIRSDIEYISSQFMFKDYDIVPRLEICFLWDNSSYLDLTKAIDLLTELSDLVDIEYAYSYPAVREMSTFEWITEKGFFSSGTTV